MFLSAISPTRDPPVAIHCPNCNHGMSIKDAKPGRYKPKCSKCGRRFALTIFPESDRVPLAERLPSEPAAGTVTAPVSPQQTVPAAIPRTAAPVHPADATLPSAANPAATLPAVSAEATLAFDAKPPGPAVVQEVSHPRSKVESIPGSRQSQGSTEATIAGPAAAKTQSGTEATIASVHAATVHTNFGDQKSSAAPAGAPDRIGGYKIVKELGRGAMGAVYLAKQLSLDRDVALKTIQAQWASHPTFIARFTREAYAAAQLTHHNVVQIYDLGVDGGTNYFSMEFVRGESLDDLIKRNGPLPPEMAVGFILQAARGLQFAHSHGMVHRDVKPANMMLNEQGVVKIADLGLVKVAITGSNGGDHAPMPAPGTAADSLAAAKADVTMVNVAMGTPAYMAPEQADNAAGVDHRADIYSLGCSLYVMLTGKPPFEGATAIEVMTKHRTVPVVRPDVVISNIPKPLADITLKMVAKQPDQRYQNLADLIGDLERFLGGGASERFGPTAEQAALIDQEAKRFHQAPLAKLRGVIAAGFLGACLLLFAALLYFSWSLAGAVIALGLSTVVTYLIAAGLSTRSPLFDRTRAVVFSARWSDWLTWIGGGLVFVLALWLFGWLWLWIAASVVGIGLGVAYSFAIDRRLAEQRRGPIESIEALLRGWRVKGLDEASLQLFIAQHSGSHWEELYETLFGYEAKLALRQQLGQSATGAHRAKFRAWREPLIRWLDQRLRADREERDRRHLQKLEEQNLRSQGVDPQQARQQAGRIAEAMVDDAAAARSPVSQKVQTPVDPAVAAAEKREKIKRMLADAKSGARPPKRRGLAGTALAPVAFVLSGKVRFLLGCLLLAGCAMWAKQNELVSAEQLRSVASDVSQNLKSTDVYSWVQWFKLQTGPPLRLPIVGRFFDSPYPGIAGLMLIVLGLFRGWKMSLFALPAAALIVVGPAFGLPRVVMLLIGLILGAVGMFFGRSGE